MKITNFELLNIMKILDNFANKHLPQKIGFAIVKSSNNMKTDVQSYQTSLQNIIDSYKNYVEKDGNGDDVITPIGVPQVDDEHMDDYMKEINELLNIEIELNIYTIDEEVFDYDDQNGKYDVLSASEIMQLESILCHKEEDKEIVEE